MLPRSSQENINVATLDGLIASQGLGLSPQATAVFMSEFVLVEIQEQIAVAQTLKGK